MVTVVCSRGRFLRPLADDVRIFILLDNGRWPLDAGLHVNCFSDFWRALDDSIGGSRR